MSSTQPEASLAPSTTTTNAGSASTVVASNPPAPRASPAAPAQAAVAAPAESFLSHKTNWVAGVLLAAVVAGFGWLALRRYRATPHASLITRSLDREKRP